MITVTGFENLSSPVRSIKARVELFDSNSTLLNTFTHDGALSEFSVERIGEESKFFGFGICQKGKLKLIDKERQLTVASGQKFVLYLGIGETYIKAFPEFTITEVNRDENTNALSITGYDKLYSAPLHYFSESTLSAPYTLNELTINCAALLGIGSVVSDFTDLTYPEGANLEGSEALLDIYKAIAEATQTIYFLNANEDLVFKKLDRDGAPVITLDKEKYFTLKSGENRRLTSIVSTTELGDNYTAETGLTGTTQFVRDNPLWDLREDIADLVIAAVDNIGNLTINQFECDWRGNFLVEIGDKIGLITKDENEVFSYLLDDTITYNGGLVQKTQWQYQNNDTETASNAANIGEVLKQTYAKVDKVNKEIDLVAGDINATIERIGALEINTDSISASVSSLETTTKDKFEDIEDDIEELKKEVELLITDEFLEIKIKEQLENGVSSVTTNTGYKFDDTGLTVSKTNSEMSTTITEDGMTVAKNGETMLTANNSGVVARNLHAETYLIIGKNSRFEDFVKDGEDRTACFWIGG